MKYTDEQLKVINAGNRNVLVSAAAGSGKTAVIVERIIRKVIDGGTDIDRLLVVTFTKAAAREMKERIRDALEAAIMEHPGNTHLEKQLTLVFSAQITTIDSFCLDLIRNNFNICSIDPGFRVADEGELTMLRADTLSALMDRQYEDNGDGSVFYDFLEHFSTKRSDEDVTETIIKLYDFAMSRPDPEGFLKGLAAEYSISDADDLEKKKFVRQTVQTASLEIKDAAVMLEKAVRLCEKPGGPYIYAPMLEEELRQAQNIMSAGSFSAMYAAFGTLQYARLSSKKDDSIDAELRERVKTLRNAAKKRMQDVQARFFFTDTDTIIKDMSADRFLVEELSRLSLEFLQSFREAKKKRGIVDFSDLEHLALEILGDAETRARYSSHYDEIIIDEYQDSNRVQEAIFSSVSNGHDYFCVGDVKQSIYSFRDACPELFMDRYKNYGSGKDETSELITLSKNFRSRGRVLDAVNSVFAQIMTSSVGGIDYDDRAALHDGGAYKLKRDDDKAEFIISQEDPETDRKETEAQCVASRIKELHGIFDVEDRKTGLVHKCTYHDIVILLRAVTGWEDVFMNVLKENGIPVHAESRSGYLLSDEIRSIMNFLNVIDNPLQDIELTGVLSSVFGDFSDDDLALVRAFDMKGSFYSALKKCAAGEGLLSEKAAGFIRKLSAYREMTAYTPIHELIEVIIRDHGYDHIVRSMPAGEKRLANLHMLLYRAREFEKTSYRGLFHFIRYIENMKKYDIDFGEADTTGENDDAVRIMSIHHSKGLEFPVVFLCGLAKKFNQSDSRSRLMADDELGAGLDHTDPFRRVRYRSLIKNVIAEKQKRAGLGEELRVLYVAMTRAEEKLIMTCTAPAAAEKLVSDVSSAGSMADMIAYACDNAEDIENCIESRNVSIEGLMADRTVTEAELADSGRAFAEGLKVHTVADDRAEEALIRVFDYKYPHMDSEHVPQKVSVSVLKHEAMEEAGIKIEAVTEEKKQCIPRFISGLETQPGGPVIGALRGTAYHTAFENLPFGEIHSLEDVRKLSDMLVVKNKLSARAAGMIDPEDILKFAESPLAARMTAACRDGRLFREQPFVILVNAEQIDSTYPADESVMVQGIIDAFFEENGSYVIMDYKTDRVRDPSELVLRYRAQLDYYAQALRQITGREATEEIIYSVTLGMEIKVK